MNERMKQMITAFVVAALAFAGSYFGARFSVGGQAQVMGTSHVTSDVEFGVDGTGVDVTFYSGTSGDSALWDASDVALEITGTSAQNALHVVTGDAEFDGTLDTDGGITVDGGALDVNDAVDVDGSSDEAQLSVTGYTTQTSDLVQFDGGMVDIGGASASVADGDNDLAVAGDLEVDGEAELDGALDADSTADIAGAVTLQSTLDVQGGDITMQNDETLSNSTDGTVQVGGLFALTEQTLVELDAAGQEITPSASYIPITADGAYTATIADGSVAGTVIVIINEGGSNDITLEEASYNAQTGGDVVLTGGADDAITLLWDGSAWIAISSNPVEN